MQHEAICCVVQSWSLHANVHFHCKNRCGLNDFDFALRLVNVILVLSNLSSKVLKMRPKLASKAVFSVVQNVHSLRIVSKFNFKANSVNRHPNETHNRLQNRGHELAVRASVRVGAFGPTKQRLWS